jgi:hypothetical protein
MLMSNFSRRRTCDVEVYVTGESGWVIPILENGLVDFFLNATQINIKPFADHEN